MSAGLIVQGLCDRSRLWMGYLAALLLLWAAGWLAGSVEWTRPVGEPVRIALAQANVPLTIKWLADHRDAILERYISLSAEAKGAELVVWPEAAMPAYLDQIDANFFARLRRQSGDNRRDFLIGVVERDRTKGAYYNSVISVGSTPGIYRKRHLVPLGEFLPLKSITSWLLNYLDIPMSDFSAGAPNQRAMRAAGETIGVSVCYEDAFGQEIIRALPEATLLVNVSEDAWFGDSLAPHQRLQMARMRAMETGRPMLRAANTGLSAVIDPRGEVVASSPQFQAFLLSEEVQPMQGTTPYARFGNGPVVLLIALLIAASWVSRQRFAAKADR